MTGSLLALVAAIASAWGMPWWVSDAEEARAVAEALDAHWPDHPMTIQIGAPDGWEDGVWMDDGAFVLASDGQLRRADAVIDAATQVALARSWSRKLTLSSPGDGGGTPLDVAPPEVSPVDPSRLPPLQPGPLFTAGHGPIWRMPDPTPAYHLFAQGGWQWSSGYLAAMVGLDTAETVITNNGVVGTYHRVVVALTPGVTIPIGGGRFLDVEMDWGRAFGVLTRENQNPPITESWVSAYALRGRLWSRISDGAALGIGGVLGGDSGGFSGDPIPLESRRPLFAAIEMTVSLTPRGGGEQ